MRDLIKLIEKINKVIALFLSQKKIGVTAEIFQQSSVDIILANLNSNISYYKNLPTQASDVPQSTFWRATKTVISSMQYLYQTTESTVRFLTNTDSRYRLDTIAWLNWTRQHFAMMAEQYGNLSNVTDLRLYVDNLKIEIRAFFSVIDRMLNDTSPDVKSAFLLERDDKKFLIYGLKDSPSELTDWFKQYLVEKFRTPALLESIMDDCRGKCEVIVARTDQQAMIAEHREPLMATIKKLQENNAALERELAYTNSRADQYQSDLQDSQARTVTLMQDLGLKESQERAYEESIKRLTLEKETIELRQQTQRTENPKQNELLRGEIETLRRRLESAVRDKEATLAEKNKLAAAVQTEHQQQEELRLQLERVKQEKEELTREMPTVTAAPADVSKLDEHTMTEILEPYSQPEEVVVGETLLADEDEYDDELDLDLLVSRLKEHAREIKNDALVKKPYPLHAEAVERGCTSAQNHVFRGKVKYLQDLLLQQPETVNTICKDKTNPLGSKTLLELAMFHVNFLVLRATRKAMVELILSFRPTIDDSHLCVRETIRIRIRNNDRCDFRLRELFCQYVIAQKTCTAEARAELTGLMKKVESLFLQLQQTPDVILVDGQCCDVLLQELEDALRVCRLLCKSYVEGDVQPLLPILSRETPVENPEFYEILLDPAEKTKADAAYKLKHKRSSYRVSLIEIIDSRIKQCVAARPAKRIINDICHDEGKAEAVNITGVRYDEMKIEQASRGAVDSYEDLSTSLLSILVRYGIVLSANGFNPYQLAEIKFQRSLEIDLLSCLNNHCLISAIAPVV